MIDKGKYDSEFCGNLPIHNINLIQDYGYLLVVDRKSLEIIQFSENLSQLFDIKPQDLVNKPFKTLLEQEQIDVMLQKLNKDFKTKVPFTLHINIKGKPVKMLALVHSNTESIIIELETLNEKENSFIDVYQDIKYLMAAIEVTTNVKDACQITIEEIRKLADFDSVLLYQFDEEWNGTVIAETNSKQQSVYLGLKFPASDVPKKARDLYLKNIFRLIPNRNYKPIKLFPVINPQTNTFLDLSDCNLRAVLGVHLEYMNNMGIMASMSIRITKNDQLWGLISCHHKEPKYLNYEKCSVFELISSVISNKISSLINLEEYEYNLRLQNLKIKLTQDLYQEQDFFDVFFADQEDNILEIFNASGAVLLIGNQMKEVGKVPSRDDLDNLVLWLQAKKIDQVFSSHNFMDVYEDATNYVNIASGILVIPIDNENGDFLILFRPEVVQTINWGGNPNEAINFEEDGKKYHPRNSFKVWNQTLKNNSLPWHPAEIATAENLKNVLFEFKIKHFD